MKAILIDEFGGIDKLHFREVETPLPLPGELLLKVVAAGVNPVDWKIREGWLKKRIPHEFPLILGWDVAGVVVKVGEGVEGFSVGDPVFAYARKEVVQWGTFAEYVAVDASAVAPKPVTLSFAEAAAIPLVGLTAWQALFDTAHLKAGQTALIHAGSGGVGSLAIQFAKWAGAKVITTCGPNNLKYVKQLGADQVIDYTAEDFTKVVGKVDFVMDNVGGKVLEKSFRVVKEGGWLVTITDLLLDPSKGAPYGIHAGAIFVHPSGEELSKIGQLIEEGKVQVPAIEEFPWQEVGTALEKSRAGHTRGKIVLRIGGT
jgi:NADPH2:quinone reductase